MLRVIHPESKFSNRILQYPSKLDALDDSAKKPKTRDGNTSARRINDRPLKAQNWDKTQEWNTIQWDTDQQSHIPDGKFGPAKQMSGWRDCWFTAALAAVSHDKDGQQILMDSILKDRVKGVNGHRVTFSGGPEDMKRVFISDKTLNKCLNAHGGDADTRLMQLAADMLFSVRGYFKSLYIASKLKSGLNQKGAEEHFRQFCRQHDIADPMGFNPMRIGGQADMAMFMFTNINADTLESDDLAPLSKSQIETYLKKHVTDDRDGASVTMHGLENPLGGLMFAQNLSIVWDVIRTDIKSDGRVDQPERIFLDALANYLVIPDKWSLKDLRLAAENLKLESIAPVRIVNILANNQGLFSNEHRNVLRSAVEDVIDGGIGYIGFAAKHAGTLEGINMAANTFTYSEPNFPTVVHTGKLSDLVQAIQDGNTILDAVEPEIDHHRDELLETSSWDPPLNSSDSKRSLLQTLRLALATLNVRPVKKLADYLEYLDDKGVAGNDRYGLYGVWKLAQLPLDSPHWDIIADPLHLNLNIRPEYRQMIKEMASRIVDPEYKSLMDRVIGSHGIFDTGELETWLSHHRRNGAEPDSIAFHKFCTSVEQLNEKAVTIMEYLEWEDDPKSNRDNKRFGMRGIQLLSRLTPASEQWEASGSGHLDNVSRQELIDEAKLLMNRDYALWTFQVHQGDMVFEPGDMQKWLDLNRPGC